MKIRQLQTEQASPRGNTTPYRTSEEHLDMLTLNHTVTPSAYQPSQKARLSHELRMPLMAILGMSHFLRETQLTQEQKECVRIIESSADQLLSLEVKMHQLLRDHPNSEETTLSSQSH